MRWGRGYDRNSIAILDVGGALVMLAVYGMTDDAAFHRAIVKIAFGFAHLIFGWRWTGSECPIQVSGKLARSRERPTMLPSIQLSHRSGVLDAGWSD